MMRRTAKSSPAFANLRGVGKPVAAQWDSNARVSHTRGRSLPRHRRPFQQYLGANPAGLCAAADRLHKLLAMSTIRSCGRTIRCDPILFPGIESMKRQLIVLALMVLVSLAGAAMPAVAQTAAPQLATWDVQLWPEYDEPSVLVIITGAAAEGATLPQTLRIPLPAGARLHAVAYPDATGNLLTLPWTTEASEDGQTVVFDLNQPSFVIEYYADILSPPPSRSFELNLVAPYAAQQASLSLRQPSRASDLQVTPAMTAGGSDSLGNPTYALELGALQAGQNVPVQVSYTKADADPSVAGLAVAEAPEASVDSTPGWLPWAIGVALGLAAGAVVVYFLLRRRSTGASRQVRRRQARKQGAPARPPVASPAPGGAQIKFCVQCGQKFEGNDKFCRNCGAARR